MAFLDNLTEFLEDKLKEFNPDIDVSEGTAVRDIFIKPLESVNQPIQDEIINIQKNLSLIEGADLPPEELDRLAANFFVTRREGGKARGSVRIFFSDPIDLFLPQGTVFTAADGQRFLSLIDNQITSIGLRLNIFGQLFFADVDVEAESAGESGNIDENFIVEVDEAQDEIVQVTNPAAFTGGFDTETNQELLDRLLEAITIRNLINKPGSKIILLENFNRIADILVVGFNDKQTITGEQIGIGDGSTVTYQLSEDEDIVDGSLSVQVDVVDETVATGGGFVDSIQNLDFFPYDFTTLQLKAGPSFAAGIDLISGTDFDDVGADTTIGEFHLTATGAAKVNGEATPDIHAKYTAGPPIDSSLVSADFFGVVTFTVAPSSGAVLTAEFTHFLMRRDRLSGDNLELGDDTFGTQTNVHIGGKVDFYLKFAGLESKEERIDSLVETQFLFPQGSFDPAPTSTEQYIGTVTRPIIEVLNVEEVNPLNDLPSGIFLTEGSFFVSDETVATDPVTAAGSPYTLAQFPISADSLLLSKDSTFAPASLLTLTTHYTVNATTGEITITAAGETFLTGSDLHARYSDGDFTISILPNKTNINFSARQRIQLNIHNPSKIGLDVFFRYQTSSDIPEIQEFIEADENRIVTADLLAFAPLPVFVDLNLKVARLNTSPTLDETKDIVVNFINNLKLGACLSTFDLVADLSSNNVKFMQIPITLNAERVNRDFSTVQLVSQDKIEVPANFQFVARDITVTEIPLTQCQQV